MKDDGRFPGRGTEDRISGEMRAAERECERRYGDILYLRRPVSTSRPPLSMEQKAAQFSPFAALTGYGDAVAETARFTDERIEFRDDAADELDMQLALLRERLPGEPEITVTCFVPDSRKEGGAYRDFSGRARKIDDARKELVFTDGRRVPVPDIAKIAFRDGSPGPSLTDSPRIS